MIDNIEMPKNIPKLPCIVLSTKLVKRDDDPLISKIDSVPYIDKHLDYPTKNGEPMMCIMQLNMDHIFGLLQNKKSDKTIRNYFRQYPQTGLIQIYMPHTNVSTCESDDIYIQYIAEYDIKNHDTIKYKKLQKIYTRYRKEQIFLFEFPNDKKNYNAYITNAVYAYDFLNWTMGNHPDWHENMKSIDQKYISQFDKQDNESNNIQIGGFPYHLQDDFDFDENDYVLLLSFINDFLGLNIAIQKDKLANLEFDDALIDLAYD